MNQRTSNPELRKLIELRNIGDFTGTMILKVIGLLKRNQTGYWYRGLGTKIEKPTLLQTRTWFGMKTFDYSIISFIELRKVVHCVSSAESKRLNISIKQNVMKPPVFGICIRVLKKLLFELVEEVFWCSYWKKVPNWVSTRNWTILYFEDIWQFIVFLKY